MSTTPYVPPYIIDQAARIVAAIKADLTDRRGLRQEWDQIDRGIQQEIADQWAALVEAELERPNPDVVAVGGSIVPYVLPVKPLVWTPWNSQPTTALQAWWAHHSQFPIATIKETPSAFVLYTLSNRDGGDRYPTLEAAQAAAQDEWAAFIRAALDTGTP